MSQNSALNSTASTPAPGSSPVHKPPTHSPVKTKNDEQDVPEEDPKRPVLPWEDVDHEIPVTSFTGYKLNLNGWVRRDIRYARNQDTGEEQHNNITVNGGANDAEDDIDAEEVVVDLKSETNDDMANKDN